VAWYHFGLRAVPPGTTFAPAQPAALTAAAAPVAAPRAELVKHPERWQNEAWGYYDTLGELNYGISWKANMMSRVRLRAGMIEPGSDEPTLLDKGPAADLMSQLGNGIGGRSEIMRRLTVQLDVPGECYLIGETVGGMDRWQVRSVDEVRVGGTSLENGGSGFQVTREDTVNTGMYWRDLAPESMNPVRVWRPHDRWYHLADSPMRSGLAVARELELANRKITAEYLSRIASAGVLVMPSEVSFPVREEFTDAEDPFAMEFVELAAEAIKTPGTAAAVVPLMVRVPAEFAAAIRHIDFTVKLDDKIIERRDQAIRRLATKLDVPSDVILGLQDMNHWNAWASDDQGLQVHVSPTAELICDCLTRGYLHPRLKAMGEDVKGLVVWYDMSELTLRPDRAANAQAAYDRLELSGKALRRETGFDESDAPSKAELQDIGLKTLIHTTHGAAPAALDVLIGKDLLVPATQGPGAVSGQQVPVPEPGQTPAPDRSGNADPAVKAPPAVGPPGAGAKPPGKEPAAPPGQAAAAQRLRQASTQHAVAFRLDGTWDLRHPEVCADHPYSCPFTTAVTSDAPQAVPGLAGTYLCSLDTGTFGQQRLRIDGQALYLDTSGMVSTVLTPRRVNGHAHA
jgi:hypothetical protein